MGIKRDASGLYPLTLVSSYVICTQAALDERNLTHVILFIR